MSHMIDETTGVAAIAYAGEAPWHRLGQPIDADAPLEVWQRQARLDYTVQRAPVLYAADPKAAAREMIETMAERHGLYRSDTKRALSVVGNGYRIVQPIEVIEAFRDVVEAGKYRMETMGALSQGRRIWALARINDGADVIGHDRVLPYLLLATSYDGTLATTGKLTAIRVVCHNTISAALDHGGAVVRINHSARFDAAAVKRQLGVAVNAWDAFLDHARTLAQRALTTDDAASLTVELLPPVRIGSDAGSTQRDPRESRGFKRIMALFDGQEIGAQLTEGPSAWRWLNAVTEYVDHDRGRSDDSRMSSAWFGQGDNLKSRALRLALSV